MSKPTSCTVAEKLKDRASITKAIQRGVREAILTHAHAGHPIVVWQNGKVVWLSPEEVFRLLGLQTAGNSTDASMEG
jgi:hypothetical protein